MPFLDADIVDHVATRTRVMGLCDVQRDPFGERFDERVQLNDPRPHLSDRKGPGRGFPYESAFQDSIPIGLKAPIHVRIQAGWGVKPFLAFPSFGLSAD